MAQRRQHAEGETNTPEFDQYQNWLKYQAIAERLWARRGFYQTSGAFGFRDQLQDSVNLIWVDPALARKQILLHASQQFWRGTWCTGSTPFTTDGRLLPTARTLPTTCCGSGGRPRNTRA
ncbi:MAG: hypothetical protein IPN23_11250 [Elusimicrobia bacterium]|nr:hypothetical protein [Elusimicrobiota bacterium]